MGKIVPVHIMQAYRGEEVYCHSFFITVLDGDEWFSFMPWPKKGTGWTPELVSRS